MAGSENPIVYPLGMYMNGLIRISVPFVLRYFCNNFTWKVHHRCTCKGIKNIIFMNNCSTESLQFEVYKSKINSSASLSKITAKRKLSLLDNASIIFHQIHNRHTLEWRNNIASGTCIIENQQAGRRPFDFSYTKARITAPSYELPAFKTKAIRSTVSHCNCQPGHPPEKSYF